MPANGASSIPRPDLNLLDERRSAHASIRGYLYQTCLGVQRWLDLKADEVLLCEGDEDLDRFLLDGTAVSEQVKAYTGGLSITGRVVRDSLRNFLRSYVALRQRGGNRKFVFTTTAFEKKKRAGDLDFSLLEKWKEGDRTQDVIARVQCLLRPPEKDPNKEAIKEASTWLDQQKDGWAGFMDAVEWSFSAPELDALRGQLERKLMTDRAGAAAAQLLDRLIGHALRTSSRSEVKEQVLTREILDSEINSFLADLGRWAGSPEGLRIRTIFDEIDSLRDLLGEGTRELPANPTPGQILTAAYEVIPFDETGRQEELDLLASWCASDARRSVLLLTGEGGSGKTRLMLEWCRRLRHQGWHAGLLMRNREKDQILPLLKGTAPRLVVLDYAETRLEIVEPLLIEMGQAPQKEGPTLRVILLARQEADWWRNLSQLTGDVEALLSGSSPRKLSELIPQNLAARQQVFHEAVASYAKTLDLEGPKDLSVPDISGANFERVLYLHMASLLALKGERIETAEDTLKQTLAHERRFWRPLAKDLNEAMKAAVAALTLVGGASTSQQAQALLARVLQPFSLQPQELRTIQRLLQDLFPSSLDRYLDPLQPDLLGEQLIMETLVLDASLLARVLDGATLKEGYSTLTVLTRLAQRRSDNRHWIRKGIHGRLAQLAETALNVAIDTGDPVGIELAEELDINGSSEEVLWLQRKCEEERYLHSVPLREVAQVATDKSLSLLRERQPFLDETEWNEYARLANNLGNRLSEIGRHEDALQPTMEAVDIRRQLARQRPEAFRYLLAGSLNNLGCRLRDLGQREEALQAMHEAMEVITPSALQPLGTFQSDLATSFHNFGVNLRSLGRPEEALYATREAIKIRRQLAERRPDAFRPVLATSLNGLGIALRDLGRREEALPVIQEAVQINRQLARQRPDAFRPALAHSLINLSAMLRGLGRRDEALRATQEAVEICRQLAQQRPAAFQSDLATSLDNLGGSLSELERRDEALRATQEAVQIRRLLAQKLPTGSLAELAASLNNLGTMLSELGQREEALQAAKESVEIRRQLVHQHPNAFRPHLASSLDNLGGSFSNLGRLGEALQATKEAVEIRRLLAQQRPDAFLPELAGSLNNLGLVLNELRRGKEAFQAIEEAVQIYSTFFLYLPAAFARWMEMMVTNYRMCAEGAGREPDETLLAPVLAVLESLRSSEEPTV